MRYPKDHNRTTRQRILAAAARIFRREGFHGAGISAIMQEAGMTKGGFSQHFDSKEALLAETLTEVLSQKTQQWFAGCAHLAGRAWVADVVARYLNPAHRRNTEEGCPIPALFSELTRAGALPKAAFEAKIREAAADIAPQLSPRDGLAPEDQAFALLAACYGGLTMSRAVADEDLADRILTATRSYLQDTLGST